MHVLGLGTGRDPGSLFAFLLQHLQLVLRQKESESYLLGFFRFWSRSLHSSALAAARLLLCCSLLPALLEKVRVIQMFSCSAAPAPNSHKSRRLQDKTYRLLLFLRFLKCPKKVMFRGELLERAVLQPPVAELTF